MALLLLICLFLKEYWSPYQEIENRNEIPRMTKLKYSNLISQNDDTQREDYTFLNSNNDDSYIIDFLSEKQFWLITSYFSITNTVTYFHII